MKNKNLPPNFPIPQVNEKKSFCVAPTSHPPDLKAESDKMTKSFGLQSIFN